jgi:pilus assembly protein CpaB
LVPSKTEQSLKFALNLSSGPADAVNRGRSSKRQDLAGEMKEKIVTLFGVAFVVSVVTTGIFYGLVSTRFQGSAAVSAGPQVVVATRPIDKGTILQKSDLKTATWAGKAVPAGAYTRPELLTGATLLEAVAENEPFVEMRVVTPKVIPSGMRVISIHASDSSGVVSMLRPGYKVDVQVISSRSGDQTIRTVLQGVEVLNAAGSEGGRPVVNLMVTPEEADVLGLADSVARLRLVLRNEGDEKRPGTNPFPASQLLGPGPSSSTVKPIASPSAGATNVTSLISQGGRR